MMVRASEYKNACKIHISKAKKNPSKPGEQFLEENGFQVNDDGLSVLGTEDKAKSSKSSKTSGPSE